MRIVSRSPVIVGRNFNVQFECGCSVVFMAESAFRTSRLDACQDHRSRDGVEDRDRIVAAARVERDRRREEWRLTN